MRPKHLKYPFNWEDRKVLIHDRIWYVPCRLQASATYEFPGWSAPEVFGNENPVHVEYCSGNGDWIAQRALRHPQINWVAIEMQFPRVRKIWSKLKNFHLANLLILCGEGVSATANYFPAQSLGQAYVNFPDPWPKRKHAKNRMISPKFLREVDRTLAIGGVLTMVTDDEEYSKLMIRTALRQSDWSSLHPCPYYVTHLEGYGISYFEKLWRSKGKKIYYHQYKKEKDRIS